MPLRRLASCVPIVCALLAACGDDIPVETGTTTSSISATIPPASSTIGDTTSVEPTGPTSTPPDPTLTTDTTLTSDSTSTSADDATTGGLCPMGTVVCKAGESEVCDGMGGFTDAQVCADECLDGVGCVLCIPGAYQCTGTISEKCNEAGDAWVDPEDCDSLQGLACDPDSGACSGACTRELLGTNYIGCDYYPLVTPQYPGYDQPLNPFAVAVSNTGGSVAKITVTRGGDPVAVADVMPDSVQTITLPWISELSSMNGPTGVVPKSAYRLRSSQPVNVYQYNPLEATITNDASLLVPTNAWTGNYLVASWQHWDDLFRAGFYSVIARDDDTTVTLEPSTTGNKVSPGAGVQADGTGVVVLQASDVLVVRSDIGGDSTGTIVHADRPVHVIAGHPCTNVPLEFGACDHLEESMFPIETLATEYIVTPTAQVGDINLAKAQNVRVIASAADTTLTFVPDQPVDKLLAKAGDFVEIPLSTAAFKVSADHKIAVAQYMVGQGAGYGESDPSMLMNVAVAQYRKTYLFFAPTSWTANYVDIIAPNDTSATVDGAAVGGWIAIPGSGYAYSHVLLSNAGNGTHTIDADKKVGISVYGILEFGSYWYPGGLDLAIIPQ